MKILVTGHKGFIGQNMVKALGEEHEVTGFEWGEMFPGYDYDLVIHLGAISSTTETDVDKIMRQNYDFSVWLIEMCNSCGMNLQYASSASVYGLDSDFKENTPVDPKSPYAWSKYMFERYAQSKEWEITVQGFRYFNVYGPHEDHKDGQASPHHTFTKQAKETGVIKLFENSQDYKRDFVPVQLITDTHQRFFSVDKSGVWNIGTGESVSFEDVARKIANEHGAKIEYIPMPVKLQGSYQKYTCANMTKTKNTLSQVAKYF
jgi:ADP-L-glycero-D-manno-heptose 6-epimerase